MGGDTGGGVRLAAGLGVVTLVLFVVYSGVLSVLLPTQVARIDPAGKVGALALVTSVSFGVTAFAQPLIGALSDRTRGAWGRRRPWMLAGAVVGGAAVALLGATETVPLLVVLWAVSQFALNGTDIASTAYLVDRYPPARRARIVAVFASAALGGGALGTVLVGRVADRPLLASTILAVTIVLVVSVFVLLARDDTVDDPRERFSLRAFLAGFLVDPRRHPDFAWLLASRFSFVLGHQAIYGYLLFVLTDHLGIAPARATGLLGVITIVGAAGVVVSGVVVAVLSDRIGRRVPFLAAAGAGSAAATLLLILTPEIWAMFVVAAALGIGLGVSIVAGTALASETLPGGSAGAGRGLGIYNFGGNLAQAGGPLLAAAAITWLGGYPALFAAAAGGMLVSAILVTRVREAR